MNTSSQSLVPALLLPLFAWRVYRRFHRNVGRQPLVPARLVSGIVIFGVITLGLLAFTFTAPKAMAGLGGGLAMSLPIAALGLKLARFETDASGKHYYTPNTYIGVGLTLLLAGRFIYRFGVLYYSGPDVLNAAPPAMLSPLTLFLIGLTAGYYITFNTGVLIKGGKRSEG